jgi:hypothetical protein
MTLSLICTDLRDCYILPVPVLGSSEFLDDDSAGVRWRNLMTSSLYRFGGCELLLPGSVPGSVRVCGEGPWRGGEIS